MYRLFTPPAVWLPADTEVMTREGMVTSPGYPGHYTEGEERRRGMEYVYGTKKCHDFLLIIRKCIYFYLISLVGHLVKWVVAPPCHRVQLTFKLFSMHEPRWGWGSNGYWNKSGKVRDLTISDPLYTSLNTNNPRMIHGG